MAGPEDWGAVPGQQAANGPAAWGAQSAEEPHGLLGTIESIPGDVAALGTAQGRAAWAQVPAALAKSVYGSLKDFFTLPHDVAAGEVSPDEEIERSFNAAEWEIGGGEALPRAIRGDIGKAVAPAAKAFDDGIAAPAAVRLDAFARAGDPNGVRLEPPTPEVKPAPIRPIQGSPFGDIPRSVAARTGVPEVDAVLGSPVTKAVIDNPVIDRSHDIPYMAGASDPLNNPTVFLDRHVPKEQTVGGVTFDPADPWTVHENVEQHTMQILMQAGMDAGTAYKVAHFNFAEPAEHAWYRAHGIDQETAEAQQAKWLPRIQHEPTTGDVPESLYKKPYPHDQVPGVDHEPVTETPPTPEESAQGAQIVRDWAAKQTASAQPMLQEARELGVIGPERDSINELAPLRAMAARPDEAISQEVSARQSAWRQRWEATLDKMGSSADARKVIGAVLDENDEFLPARQGDMRPAQIEQLADVTGLDSTKIDVAGTSAKIKTDAEMRNTLDAFRIVNDKIQAAARDLAAKGGAGDETEAAELTRLELQRDLLLDTTTATKGLVALRAEFGRAGNRLQEFYKAQREAAGLKNIDDVRERARLIAETPADALPYALTHGRAKPLPWYFWVVQQALISGPITHTKYAVVNTAQIFLDRVIAPELAAGLGRLRGERASFGAPIQAYNGIIGAVPAAFRGAKLAFKTGTRVPLLSEWELAKRAVENPEEAAAKVPYGSTMSPDWGIWKRVFNDEQLAKAERVLGVFGRSANFMHTFYKILGEKSSAAFHAYDAAFKEGASPLGQEFWQSYERHFANPTDDALKAIIDDAYAGTFMEKLGEQTQKFATLTRNTPLKWVFMFTHIPMNMARAAVRYSPLALGLLKSDASEIGAALRGEKGLPAQNLALSKIMIGSAVGAYFIDKALNGLATGDYPTDPAERRRWQVEGIQPNSIAVDGRWHSLERMGPLAGTVPRLAANYAAIIKQYQGGQDESLMKAAFLMALGTASVLTDEVGFETVRNIVEVLENPKEAARMASYQLASYANPYSLLAQSASAIDPYMREADTLLDGIKYRLPYLRETLLPKRDPLYGEPVANPGYHAVLRESPVNADPVKAELDRIQYYPTAPQKTIGGVKLTPEQYDRYEATAGPYVKQMLTAAMATPRYKSLALGAQRATVKGIISAGRARARAAMQMAHPELIEQGIAARRAAITGR